jgi:hypothetical protein
MKKVGRHRLLSLTNAVSLSGEFEQEMRGTPALFEMVMRKLERPQVARWLVLQPAGVPRVAVGETDDDFVMNRKTAFARGLWNAVYIGRRR